MLRDKFRTSVRDRRSTDKRNTAASGISEDITELDQLFDDLISKKDRDGNEQNEERDEANERKALLVKYGKKLRTASASRIKKKDKEDKSDRYSRKSKRGTVEGIEYIEWSSIISDQLEVKREQDKHFNNLHKQKFQPMRERFKKDKLDREKAHSQTKKNIDFMVVLI